MTRVGIVGVSGYTGQELIALMLKHPDARIGGLYSSSAFGKSIAEVFPRLAGVCDIVCQKPNPAQIVRSCDTVFLALPHTVSMSLAPWLLQSGKRVIDLSADYRLKNIRTYQEYYGLKHKDKINLARAVYGLPELVRNKIRNARLVANPGCYPTAVILALAPLVAFDVIDIRTIIIDAKSGVSGAGKKVAEGFLYCEANEDFKAYKVGSHQHAPEIDQELSGLAGKKLSVTFVPHLLPLNRGILATAYAEKNKGSLKTRSVHELYRKFYKNEPFVRIRGEGLFPRLKDVAYTNFCDIGIKDDGKRLIVIAAIDNLLKGASGQAVQNLNIMNGFPEEAALK